MSSQPLVQAFALPGLSETGDAIVEATLERLRYWLKKARNGLCGRLDDLPAPMMARVAEKLYSEFGEGFGSGASVRMLVNGKATAPWECEWTEAVRLRNPDEAGNKRPAFLLLVPPGTELLGSLDSDTFKTLSCEDVIQDILAAQLQLLPDNLAPIVEMMTQRDLVRSTTEMQRARYMLSLARNGYTAETAGLSLCLLGLWPHRLWLKSDEQRDYWLTKNREIVSRLRDGTNSLLDRIYSLELTSEEQARRLYELLSSSPDLETAAGKVATDSMWNDLDFGLWDFASLPNTVVINLDQLDLPEHEDHFQVLRLREQTILPLAWTIQPSPSQIANLTHYLVELLSSTGETVETAFTSDAIPAGKSSRRRFRLKDIRPLVEAEIVPEGLYRVRVTAWDRATNITRQVQAGEDPPNVSAYFWIKNEGIEEEEAGTTPPRKDRLVANYLEAQREIKWELLKSGRDPWVLPVPSVSWDGTGEGKAKQSTCLIQFGRRRFRVRLSNILRYIEATILARPESLGALRADLAYAVAPRELALSGRSDVPVLAPNDPFLIARGSLFAKIRGESGRDIVETSDLLALRGEIVKYAREYIKLLRDAERDVSENPQKWLDRVGLANIDTVRLTLSGLSDQTSVAILMAPTHPLRMLWSLQLALLGESWLREAWALGSGEPITTEIRQVLQGGLRPINMPPVLFDRRRVGYLQTGQIAPGWDAYLTADIADKQSAICRLSRALGCDSPTSSSEVRIDQLCERVLRYMKQHPYVGQLKLNVFNPGDGAAVTGLMSLLDESYPDLRYDIRLFSHDALRDDLGAALDQLVNPETTIGEGAEKYSRSGKCPLHPNLTYSKNRIADFLTDPRRFQAHLSLVLDVFRPRIDVAVPFHQRIGSDLFGLVQEEAVRCLGGQGAFAWERQVVPDSTDEITSGAEEAGLLREALAATQNFTSALGASPSESRGRVPTVRLDLSVGGQNLLYEIHRVSDWVLTIDRHLGIDYFDSPSGPSSTTSPGILLDFCPDFPEADTASLMLTTRVDEEIDRLVTPALQRLGLDRPQATQRVIEWLRSLSGRLAMRLLAAPIASQGVLGMALARAFLARIGLLQDTIIIPVDAHVQLLQTGIPEDVTKSRTDLILARRIGQTRQIEFGLVEVKCCAGQLTPAAYNALRDQIVEQTSKTQAALTALFDPTIRTPDRLDRPIRNQLLARWLRFYVGRAQRYGLLSNEAERAITELITDLDRGYTVSFRQTGIIFELGREEDLDDSASDLIIHRVGRLSSERLVSGEDDPTPIPPSWDRVRTTIRGSSVWSRTEPNMKDSDNNEASAPETKPLTTVPASDHRAGGIVVVDEGQPEEKLAPEHKEPDTAQTTGEADAVRVENIPTYHYLVGDTKMTPQWGVLGKLGNDRIALDLNGCNTLSIFGVQGGGKSYTMGSILEMAIQPLSGLNVLPKPLAAVVFHYNESQDYAPEFVTMAQPNRVAAEVARLKEEYEGDPCGVADILLLTPEDKVAARKQEFPGLLVEPIAFHPTELTIQDWRFLMGAVGNDSLYIKELNLVMRSLRDNITVEAIRAGIEASSLSESQRKLAGLRLRFAEQFVRNENRLREKLYPGRLVIVDIRDELIETDEALGLFVVMLRVFAGATHNGQGFSKWIAFDEAHKYIRNPALVDSVVEVIRQMRHQATSVLIASQDPPSLPVKVIELSSLVMLHRIDSPGWLKHIQHAVTALGDLTAPALARLRPGEAYLWARSATDPIFAHRAVKIHCRPRVTQHGGATKEATDD